MIIFNPIPDILFSQFSIIENIIFTDFINIKASSYGIIKVHKHTQEDGQICVPNNDKNINTETSVIQALNEQLFVKKGHD